MTTPLTISTFIPRYFGTSIKRSVMGSLVFVLLLPIAFFVYSLFQNSWNQVEQRMLEKHHLISETLVEPFTLFVSTRQQALNTLGQELFNLDSEQRGLTYSESLATTDEKRKVQRILDKHLNSFGNFVALSYTNNPESDSLESIAIDSVDNEKSKALDYSLHSLKELPKVSNSLGGKEFISPVFQSSLSSKPVVLIKHHIYDNNKKTQGLIYAEVSLEQIGRMCSKINFGVLGHCAIVDSTGHVLAHPNKAWVQEIRDLSKVSIVQKMLAGESGTTEFYSPFLKVDMVAGFSPIPSLGWGVMIPQPKPELTKILDNARNDTLIWLLVGVIVALFIAALLTNKITNPINLLIQRTHNAGKAFEVVSIGKAPTDSPTEIKQLWTSFSDLLSGLQHSNVEIKRLNASLEEDIRSATKKLLEVNKDLQITSSQDYLTSISNRRHFSQHLTEIIDTKVGENIGIIMIDIDKFKPLNDHFGHEAGDLALKHLSETLKRSVRPCDLVARLGGDEFIVYTQNLSDEHLLAAGERIRQNMEQNPLILDSNTIDLTLSIGVVNRQNTGELSIEKLFHLADLAMYESKSLGRNRVSIYDSQFEESLVTHS